jgi:prolyl-tRNA editing enzyme YbaK/EbsC (Cys-tRNA(Pro) deacylase)
MRAPRLPVGQIVKSINVLCDSRPVVVLVPGDRRVDLAKARRRRKPRGPHAGPG